MLESFQAARGTLRRYTDHRVYQPGYLRWDEFLRKSDHKPLVSVEVFNEAQERLRSRALLSTARSPPVHLEA